MRRGEHGEKTGSNVHMAAWARGGAAGTEPVSWEPLPASAQFTVKVAAHLPLLSRGLEQGRRTFPTF